MTTTRAAISPMTKFEWTEDYSVKVERFDGQHRRLFIYINQVHDAMSYGADQKVVEEILSNLIDYTLTHFIEEEVELVKNGYPDYERHKQAHDDFVAKVRGMLVRFKASEKMSRILCAEIFAHLTDWLTNHIRVVDQAYADFLSGRAVR